MLNSGDVPVVIGFGDGEFRGEEVFDDLVKGEGDEAQVEEGRGNVAKKLGLCW